MTETLQHITDIIDWYSEKSTGATIDEILDRRDQLSGYCYHMAEMAADLKIEYNSRYFIRKINVAKSKQAFLNEGHTLGKSENDALVKHQEAYNAQIEAEADAYKADVLLKSCYKVLEAMSQRLSWLKQEKPMAEQS